MRIGHVLIDVAGWSGVVVLLLAYILVSFKRVTGDSPQFQLLNLAGSLLLLLNSWHYGAFPSVATNAAWIATGLLAVARTTRRRTAA